MTREPSLGPALFSILSSLVEERTGIHYGPSDRALFSGKVAARASEAGFESALDYYYYLRYDDPDRKEFDALVDSLVVNETYFFREADPLRVLCEDILKPIVLSGRQARVWCAACSTGEEPLSLAMILADLGILDRVEVVASDISRKALAKAREGTYSPRSLRMGYDPSQSRWLEVGAERIAVRPPLRERIVWKRLNLLDDEGIAGMGLFDAILCRNVLIYFDDATINRVAFKLAQSLRADGHLLIGASESLLRFGTLFSCEERRGSFFYTRAL